MRKIFILILALSLGASADHTITRRTTFSDPDAQGMKMTSTTRTKNKRQRIEDVTEMSGFKMSNVRLVMCDLDQEAQLDPDNKIYTVRSLNPVSVMNPDPTKQTRVSKGTGKLSTHVKVQDKGFEKVAQVNAHHWIVDSQMKGTGCVGNFEYKSLREFWTSDLPSFSCPVFNGSWTHQTVNECSVTNEMTGDVAKFMESMAHEVVKEIIYVDGKPSMTRELVDFSKAALDDSLFSLEGYRKVSESEFQQAQQKKMMEMYQPK